MQALKDLLPGIISDLHSPEKQNRVKLMSEWPSIAGPKIAAHTKPMISKKGELIVWVDQPSFAYELSQRYKQSLLKRAQASLGEETIKAVRFYVGQIR